MARTYVSQSKVAYAKYAIVLALAERQEKGMYVVHHRNILASDWEHANFSFIETGVYYIETY